MQKKIIALLVSLTLVACASPTVTQSSKIDLNTGNIPALNTRSSATVGSTIYSQFHYWRKTGTQISSAYSGRIGLGRINVQHGDFLNLAQASGEPAYCTEMNAYSDPIAGPLKPACFVDRDSDGLFDAVKAAPGAIWFEAKISPGISYRTGELVVQRPDSKKTELLYQGFVGGTLKIAYREYFNDFARPSYFQDVSYQIDSFPAVIKFKNVSIEVVNANNSEIAYTVQSAF